MFSISHCPTLVNTKMSQTHTLPPTEALKTPARVPKRAHADVESGDDSDSDVGVDDLMFLLEEVDEKSEQKAKHSNPISDSPSAISLSLNSAAAPNSAPTPAPVSTTAITEANHRQRAPTSVKMENFDSRGGVWIQYRDGTAFGKYPIVRVARSMFQFEYVLAILYIKNSEREVPMPKFLNNAQVSDHVKMQAIHPVSQNKYWIRTSSLDDGRIKFKKKTWALGKKNLAFVNSDTVKFHIVVVPFHKGELKYHLAESTPEFEVRSKEQQNVTRSRQGVTSSGARPRKRRRTAESEAKRIALESVRSDIASQHKDIANKQRLKQKNDATLEHLLELTSFSSDPNVQAIHGLIGRHISLQKKQATSAHNSVVAL